MIHREYNAYTGKWTKSVFTNGGDIVALMSAIKVKATDNNVKNDRDVLFPIVNSKSPTTRKIPILL